MTPLEKLEAAIAKLSTLREAMNPGRAWPIEVRESCGDKLPRIHLGDWAQFEYHPGEPADAADAEMVSVLHRTIDAQLAVLRYALGGEQDWYAGGSPDEPAGTVVARALADAILGGELGGA